PGHGRQADLRGVDRHWCRPLRRDSGGGGLQPLRVSHQSPRQRDGELHRGLPQHRQAPLREVGATMSFSSGGGRTSLSEINVTPMVDVMLVLLIIFMVTAPLIQQGVEVDLPDANAAPIEAAEDSKL